MSRTDDLRNQGARERGGGSGGAPFVNWPQSPPAWVEGRVLTIWESQYGANATIKVSGCSDGLGCKGKDEDGVQHEGTVRPGMELNVGLNYTALEGAVTKEDTGRLFHFAFESWGKSGSTGNKYRNFAVLEIPEDVDGAPREEAPSERPVPYSGGSGAPTSPDDDMPF